MVGCEMLLLIIHLLKTKPMSAKWRYLGIETVYDWILNGNNWMTEGFYPLYLYSSRICVVRIFYYGTATDIIFRIMSRSWRKSLIMNTCIAAMWVHVSVSELFQLTLLNIPDYFHLPRTIEYQLKIIMTFFQSLPETDIEKRKKLIIELLLKNNPKDCFSAWFSFLWGNSFWHWLIIIKLNAEQFKIRQQRWEKD